VNATIGNIVVTEYGITGVVLFARTFPADLRYGLAAAKHYRVRVLRPIGLGEDWVREDEIVAIRRQCNGDS
jgi:hypothetical protein